MTKDALNQDPKLRANVQRGLDLLADRLEPIIANRLASKLGGLAWTEVLRQLDSMKGRTARSVSQPDLQAQLRMITERLGAIGFPFDDAQRNVSRLGSEMRYVRNTLSHGGSFEPDEAWRAHDTASRLLRALGDDLGAEQCIAVRDELAPLLPGGGAPVGVADLAEPAAAPAVETGEMDFELLTPREPAPRLFDGIADFPSQAGSASKTETKRPASSAPTPDASPDAEVFERAGAAPTPMIGHARLAFEPWEVSVIGEAEVLDTLRRNDSKEQVRALAAEIVDFEGPIHVDRLTVLIAKSFNVGKLHGKRQRAIAHQIRQSGFPIDAHDFAWPADIDPAEWSEFRPSSDPAREFVHVSPVELGNALEFLKERHPSEGKDALERRVLRTFGRKRLTKQFRTHLGRALSGAD